MTPYSAFLLEGIDYLCTQSKKSPSNKIIILNSSIVFMGIAAVEAKFNERISTLELGFSISPFSNAINTIRMETASLALKQRWNIFSSMLKGKRWEPKLEPYQSFTIINSLRNELVHYKAQFLSVDQVPINRLKHLYQTFKIKPQGNINVEEAETWVHSLMGSRLMGSWAKKKIQSLVNHIETSLIGYDLPEIIDTYNALNIKHGPSKRRKKD